MEKYNKSNSEILLFKKYNLIRNIGGGAFGTVFFGTNVWTNEKVAIKIEERKNSRTTLEREAYILYYLKGLGLPEVKSFGKTKKYNILIQTLLGKSLYELFNECNKKFTLKDICMIGIQILERLEYIHSKNYIHRDIKPHNFLIGTENEGLIYIIDFGLSKKYRSDRGKHVRFNISKHITGTPRFCSVNAMRGVEQSRRDDLESLCYLIIYFCKGFLPWQGLKIVSKYQRFDAITKMKKFIKIESLCEECPEEIVTFCKYTKNLEFTENPDYDYMKNLFYSVLNKNGFQNDGHFSWIKEGSKINDNKNLYNNTIHKNSTYKRLYQKIQSSLLKKRKELKEREKNQEYTLITIVENNNNSNDINPLNSIQNNYIQSNDNNILQNNLLQLNIDSYKHSYNYPLVIYSNKLSEKNGENKFNKIAQNFKGGDGNIISNSNKLLNIPDKISIIEATKSNLSNLDISNNQILFKEKNNITMNSNKLIKLHDYIRQEEKEGGVIDKDYDFKENEFFKINTPIFNSDIKDNIENNSNNTNDKNILNFNNIRNNNLDNNIKDNRLIKSTENIYVGVRKDTKKNEIIKSMNNQIEYNEKKLNKYKSNDQIENNNFNNGNKNKSELKNINSKDELNNKNKNICYIPKYNQSYIKHAFIDLDNKQDNKSESKLNYLSKTEIKNNNTIKFKRIITPQNVFKTKIHQINKNNEIYKQNNNFINKVGSNVINKKFNKENQNIPYIKINNIKRNMKNKDNKLKIEINQNKLSLNKNINLNNTELNNKNKGKILKISNRNNNKNLNHTINTNNCNSNHLFNNSNINQNQIKKNQDNKNQILKLKTKNNIIINNVIIKNNCNNLVYNKESEIKRKVSQNTNSNSNNYNKNKNINNSNMYRPLSIRLNTYDNISFTNIQSSVKNDITKFRNNFTNI